MTNYINQNESGLIKSKIINKLKENQINNDNLLIIDNIIKGFNDHILDKLNPENINFIVDYIINNLDEIILNNYNLSTNSEQNTVELPIILLTLEDIEENSDNKFVKKIKTIKENDFFKCSIVNSQFSQKIGILIESKSIYYNKNLIKLNENDLEILKSKLKDKKFKNQPFYKVKTNINSSKGEIKYVQFQDFRNLISKPLIHQLLNELKNQKFILKKSLFMKTKLNNELKNCEFIYLEFPKSQFK